MPLEPLEPGYLLMSERPRLTAIAARLAQTPEAADSAVIGSLRSTWLAREDIQTRDQLVKRLYRHLGAHIAGADRH